GMDGRERARRRRPRRGEQPGLGGGRGRGGHRSRGAFCCGRPRPARPRCPAGFAAMRGSTRLGSETVGARSPVPAAGAIRAGGLRRTAAAYVALTKPRIIGLLLVTTVPAMILARRSVPSAWLIIATLIGGSLAAGGANAMNQYLDRDIDEIMRRTRRRPLPSRLIEPRAALAFGLALGVVAFMWLAFLVNLLSAVLAIAAMGFYVLVYTMWLKRSSPQNIVIGGGVGA